MLSSEVRSSGAAADTDDPVPADAHDARTGASRPDAGAPRPSGQVCGSYGSIGQGFSHDRNARRLLISGRSGTEKAGHFLAATVMPARGAIRVWRRSLRAV